MVAITVINLYDELWDRLKLTPATFVDHLDVFISTNNGPYRIFEYALNLSGPLSLLNDGLS